MDASDAGGGNISSRGSMTCAGLSVAVSASTSLTIHSDPERDATIYYYADPLDGSSTAADLFATGRLLHDYGLFEFTFVRL
jgi:hypothetical protein